jgi:hypothetical protein
MGADIIVKESLLMVLMLWAGQILFSLLLSNNVNEEMRILKRQRVKIAVLKI